MVHHNHHNIITIKNETIPYLEEKNLKKFENVTVISIEGFTIKMNSLLLIAMSNSLKGTACSKIGKKCNFKSTKTYFLLFQKWQKINFCTRKSLKLPKMQFLD